MEIEIIKNCYVDGEPRKAGEVVDTNRASLLIGCGKAKPYDGKPAIKAKKSPMNRKTEPDATR